MAEIKRVYCQQLPLVKFAGRCYGESDKENNTFSAKWEQWFSTGLFAPLEKAQGGTKLFEDSDAYCGICGCKDGEPFKYWIGMFLPVDAPVPQGYDSFVLDPMEIAVCWVYGKEPDIYFHCCLSRLSEEGLQWSADKDGFKWCIERYVCPRFTVPDEDGNMVLDMCYSV